MTAVLSIGAVLGGVGESMNAWEAAIDRLTREYMIARKGIESPINVNIVFVVSGNVYRAEFDDVRVSKFRRNDNGYMISIAEAGEQVPANPLRYLQDRAESAFDICERRALRAKRISGPLLELRAILADVRQAVERRQGGSAEAH